MSAFVVDKVHIDVLVTAGLKAARAERGPLRWYWGNPMHRGMLDGATEDAVGQMLLDENIRSVRCRYPDDAPDELPGRSDADYLRPYTFTRRVPEDRLSVAAMCKALDGYEYQACESDDYDETQAAAYCRTLRKALGRMLPGYDDAPWIWDEQDVAKARGKAADAVREESAAYVFIGVEGGIASWSVFGGPVEVGHIDWDVPKTADDDTFREWAEESIEEARTVPDAAFRRRLLSDINFHIERRGLDMPLATEPDAAEVREARTVYGTKAARLKAADMERLAHAAGLELEAFAYGIRGIPEKGWALVWRDSEAKGWRLLFPNLWAVEAYLVAERRGAPGPVRLQDLARDYGQEAVRA